jgi:hypothetical protein
MTPRHKLCHARAINFSPRPCSSTQQDLENVRVVAGLVLRQSNFKSFGIVLPRQLFIASQHRDVCEFSLSQELAVGVERLRAFTFIM